VLRRTLADIRRSGFSISRDEMTDGAASIAAPVHCVNGHVIAAISVVVPSDGRDLQALVPAVRIAAAGITRGMRPFAL
jgi:DNA-binding IclR family transcriptional regulator